MSIFKDTFKEETKKQLEARENLLDTFLSSPTGSFPRTWFNSRNAWVRMTSAVEVEDDGGGLATNYVLQDWLGSNPFDDTYISTFGTDRNDPNRPLIPQRLGIRPIPGITSVEVKSKGAFGSLREVTVNFQCWDIKQLDILELLYMRPGYTVLVEWGWNPVLGNDGKIDAYGTEFINDVLDAQDGSPSKNEILNKVFTQASKNGNYDAHYGYIKQYGWSSRDDGGYDCTVTVISIGEIIESLKINYSPLNYSNIIYGGILQKATGANANINYSLLRDNYNRNVLAGLFYELWEIGRAYPGAPTYIRDSQYGSSYQIFHQKINIKGGRLDSTSTNTVGDSDEQVYITLKTLCSLINNYVLLKDSNNERPIKCSVFDREYLAASGSLPPDPDTGRGYLLCLAHPLQISVDPSVCAIKSNIWIGGFTVDPSTIAGSADAAVGGAATGSGATTTGNNIVRWSNKSYVNLFNILGSLLWDDVKKEPISSWNVSEQNIIDAVVQETGQQTDEFRELQRQYLLLLNAASTGAPVPAELAKTGTFIYQYVQTLKHSSFYDLLDENLTPFEIDDIILPSGATNATLIDNEQALRLDPSLSAQNQLTRAKQSFQTGGSGRFVSSTQDSEEASKGIGYLKDLLPYFYNDDPYTELGIIGNIYLNVNFLYRLIVGDELANKDSKEKLDVNLYDFFKSIATEISNATGNINNFEVHIDPIDDTLRIIDVNYVDIEKNRDAIYNGLHTIQIHNNKSTVRTYKLESQIFPNQSSIVAIGAQAGGGAMSTDNNTWLDFNKGIKDRVITKKIDPLADATISPVTAAVAQLESVKVALSNLRKFFTRQQDGVLGFTDRNFDADDSTKYKNALKDLIIFFKNLTKSDTKNRSIIPTKLSITMDGIGGLVIGHLFKIPDELLPLGYSGVQGQGFSKTSIGSKLGYVVTGIGHSIAEGDWSTTIEAQTIILDNPSGSQVNFRDLVITGSNGQTTTRPIGGNCADKTNRNGKWKNLPVVPYQQTSISDKDVVTYLKSKGNSVEVSIKRATYAIFAVESGYGQKGVNNNYIGLQTDGGGFIATDTVFVKGSTTRVDSGGNCRAFATYNTWQECIDHLTEVMRSRKQGSSSSRQMVPTKPDDSNYFGTGYANNWVGLLTTDSRYSNAVNVGKSLYDKAKSLGL